MEPLKLVPVLKDYLWGGNYLKKNFGFKSYSDKIAEAWTLSCHNDGLSVIADGDFKGVSLKSFLGKRPYLAGNKCAGRDFPVIVKLIDAEDKLSVQVHPKIQNPKSELWYILSCNENSGILCGLRQDISEINLRKAVSDGSVTDIMNKIPVHKGDAFYISAGTLHAIGSGIVLAEIQQSSNATYRVFDYDRTDKNGLKRPLHIEKALGCANLHKTNPSPLPLNYTEDGFKIIKQCEYFSVFEKEIDGSLNISADKSSFSNILIIEGEGIIQKYPKSAGSVFKKGDSFFLCAGFNYRISGKCKIILTKV